MQHIRSIKYLLWIALMLFSGVSHAGALQVQRVDAIKSYIKLLGAGDYKAMPQLFTSDAVITSSTGALDNPPHFYATLFTKTITAPHSEFINVLVGTNNPDEMAGYFNFAWTNQQGKPVSAKFLDLIIFEKDTARIKQLYIFSNIFKQEIMKQL